MPQGSISSIVYMEDWQIDFLINNILLLIGFLLGFFILPKIMKLKKEKNAKNGEPRFCDEYKGRQAPLDINPPNTGNNE